MAVWKPSSLSLSSVSTVVGLPADLVECQDEVAELASCGTVLLMKPRPVGPDLVEDHATGGGRDDLAFSLLPKTVSLAEVRVRKRDPVVHLERAVGHGERALPAGRESSGTRSPLAGFVRGSMVR